MSDVPYSSRGFSYAGNYPYSFGGSGESCYLLSLALLFSPYGSRVMIKKE